MRFLPRHLTARIQSAAKHFKVILLLGARQTGKSTLLHHLLPQSKIIVFDPIKDLYEARTDPDRFLDLFPPLLVLDEVQFAPELLAALKRRVDQSEEMGQYYLTGSQNFSVLKSVSESICKFCQTYPNMKIMPGLIIHAGNETYLVDQKTLALSWKAL